jgi:hypothetical protein
MYSIALSEPSHVDLSPGERRELRLRHLGRAETLVLRDCDAMRIGLRVGLQTICAAALGIISPVPFNAGEQIKIRLRNDVQRFATEMRGAVRNQEPTGDGNFLVGIELFSRLMPLDVMMLRRAGINDVTYVGKIWV